jgi:hypothetical protein
MRPSEEFYDMSHDPDCLKNLALSPQGTSVQSELREQLLGELRAQADPRMKGEGATFDHYVHANPGMVGFYERFMAGEKFKTPWVNATDFEKPAPKKE